MSNISTKKGTPMSKITIEILKSIVNKLPYSFNGRNYPMDLKQKIIDFHYDEGVTLSKLGVLINIDTGNLARWKRKLGGQKTAYVHGKRLRYDIRTKALAVRDYIENNVLVQDIAKEYECSTPTVYIWIHKYRDKYLEYIDAPDGIPYIIDEKKIVYGDDNVKRIRQVLQEQHKHLMCLIDTMHMSGSQAEAMKECAKETLAKEKILIEAANLLSLNGININ
jgi:transposase-like protein